MTSHTLITLLLRTQPWESSKCIALTLAALLALHFWAHYAYLISTSSFGAVTVGFHNSSGQYLQFMMAKFPSEFHRYCTILLPAHICSAQTDRPLSSSQKKPLPTIRWAYHLRDERLWDRFPFFSEKCACQVKIKLFYVQCVMRKELAMAEVRHTHTSMPEGCTI